MNGPESSPPLALPVSLVEALGRTTLDVVQWEDPLWNGTGFPRVLYLKYHVFFAKYFPLWALGVYRSTRP